ncbi:PC4 domain-containing protein [Trichonephila clavipes]|nr:PC4 domain-containing protein [Trichonephila clavipes]
MRAIGKSAETCSNILWAHEFASTTCKLTMKRATPIVISHPRAKRVCFDKDNGKASSFKPDAVPENHFHLGGHNYAIVSDFVDVTRIHLRLY